MLVIAGRRGRGKSAYAINEILETLKIGKTVWTNIPLDLRHLKNRKGACWFADTLEDLADMRDGLYVIDEAHWVASGRWRGKGDKQITQNTHQLIALSRHLKMRILFISQNFSRMDPIVREIADGVLILRKIGRVSFGFSYCADDMTDDGKPKPKVWSYDFTTFWHSKKIHKCYDDKDLFLESLRNRPPREWKENGIGYLRENETSDGA